ncbi:AAA family ATPase (plasmid) [Azospirillum sp. A29]|uniref:AAA family ATPase n=1 Tax=Azospirillum sp. A29 TaxID=3160606 RepID=UPI00367329C8
MFRLNRVVRRVTGAAGEDLFLAHGIIMNNSPTCSVMVGNNGTGKSRLISDIARVFIYIRNLKELGVVGKDNRKASENFGRNFSISEIEYICNGHKFLLKISEQDNIKSFKDEEYCEISECDVPERVIALTTSPFDKFPLSRDRRSFEHLYDNSEYDEDVEGFYHYIGLKERMGRLSSHGLIFKTVENYARIYCSPEENVARMETILNYLSLRPIIKIRFYSKYGREIFEAAMRDDFIEYLQERSHNSFSLNSIRRFGGLHPESLKKVQQAIIRFRRRKETVNKRSEVVLDLNDRESSIADLLTYLDDAYLLRRFGLVGLRSIEIQNIDGDVIDVMDASSGQINVMMAFFGLASVIKEDSLILIDEPEISLHPEWQMRYMEFLKQAFGTYFGCHYLIATHSPLVLSEVPELNSFFVTLDNPKPAAIPTTEMSGRSSDYLLVQAFRSPAHNNYYLRDVVATLLKKAARGEIDDSKYKNLMAVVSMIHEKLDKDDPMKVLIDGLLEVHEVENHD